MKWSQLEIEDVTSISASVMLCVRRQQVVSLLILFHID